MVKEIKSYSQMQMEFYKKYKNEILPILRKYESDRKKKLRTAKIVSGIFVTIACILFLVLLYIYFNYCLSLESTSANGILFDQTDSLIMEYMYRYRALLIIAIFAIMMAISIPDFIKKDFENKIKEKIMPTVCSCFGDIKWSHGNCSDGNLFLSSYVIPKYTSATYDDIFTGSYNGVNIEIVESKFEKVVGKTEICVFAGVIVKLDMNKSFASHTVIKPKGEISMSYFKLRHTELEDVEFNGKYDVYTNDEVDARYLITPSFMERLKNMNIAFCATDISCTFFKNHLIIALPTSQDLFNICSLTETLDDNDQYFQMFDEIASIIKLIDHFKLNQKTGL